uniref:Uncharacterized protein n=1 Tax=Caenorhabditis tropicalis TaxID=1561998 RepID=A0A1I7SZ01_9PELO
MGIQENETEGDSDKFSQEPQGFFQCAIVEIRKLVRWVTFCKTFMRPLLNYIVHYVRMIFQMETPRDLPKEEIEENKDETPESIETEISFYKSRETVEPENIFKETLEALRNHPTAIILKLVNEDEQLKLLENQYREMFEKIESRRSADITTTVAHSETTKEESLPIFVEFEKRKEDVDEEEEEEELAKMNEEFQRKEEEQKRVHEEEMEKMKLKRLNRKNN